MLKFKTIQKTHWKMTCTMKQTLMYLLMILKQYYNLQQKLWLFFHFYEHKLKHSRATKIVIKSLAPHKNIPPRVAVNMNNRKSVIAISVPSMYSTDRGIHRVEHSKIRN